jgi:methionine--tRNA ligase beta chain
MPPQPIKPTVTATEVEKLDVRVGTIVAVHDVAQSQKLVRLEVDCGDRRRSVLVGMKREREDPREVEGKQALFIVNVEPRRMAGATSEALVFDIGYADGLTPVLAIPEKPVPNGTRAG